MGAVAVSEKLDLGQWPWRAGGRAVVAKVTMSASYATGGDSLDPKLLGLKNVYEVAELVKAVTLNGQRAVTIPAQGFKVHVLGTTAAPLVVLTAGGGTPAEAANASNNSTVTFYAIFVGD